MRVASRHQVVDPQPVTLTLTPTPTLTLINPGSIFMRGGQEVYRLEGMPAQDGALEALVEQHLGLTL